MNERHKTDRAPPLNHRPPHKGWSRRNDVLDGATVWRLWKPDGDRVFQMQLVVRHMEIALGGRWIAALKLRKVRREMAYFRYSLQDIP